MQDGAVAVGHGTGIGKAPLLVSLCGKLVLEILPPALASVIGAFLLAHYQFGRPAAPAAAAPVAVAPASTDIVKLVGEEHAMLRDFLLAQQAAEKNRAANADAADARAAADAKPAASAPRRAAVSLAAAKPVAPRSKPTVVAAAANTAAAVTLPAVVVAGPRPNAVSAPAPAAAPARVHPWLVAQTLAVKDHVVTATLHAVMSIGGIPSWIGHHVGADNLDADESPSAS
jgi:hypothetical protein